MRLTLRALNRTLLRRQRLLERVDRPPDEVADRVLGLAGQEAWSPHLSLAARVERFDPGVLRHGLDDGRWVLTSTLRGTLHVHTVEQARWLRAWLQPSLDRQVSGHDVPLERLREAVAELLDGGPLPREELNAELAARLPGHPALALVARLAAPLTLVGDEVRWLDLGPPPGPEEVVRRYLAAYGPATTADLAVWSGVTGLRPVLTSMDDLVRHEGPDGKRLLDVADGELADEDEDAPVRLLGAYDELWLAHAARDRVTPPGTRRAWMGGTGAVSHTVFVDGWLTGLWRAVDGRVTVTELFRELDPRERAELDEEVRRVEEMMTS